MLPSIARVIDYVDANLDQQLTLDDLARVARLSRSRLCYLFRTEVGVSPGQYVKAYRLRKARAFLEATSLLSIKEIAARVRLDQSHFVRNFKKTNGVTPRRYRGMI